MRQGTPGALLGHYFMVVVRLHDEPSYRPYAWMVKHDVTVKGAFMVDYRWALDRAKKNNPDEWTIDDVLQLLLTRGWDIAEDFDPLQVEY